MAFFDSGLDLSAGPLWDTGITIVFVVGMFTMSRYPQRIRQSATLTLVGVVGYLVVRGFVL